MITPRFRLTLLGLTIPGSLPVFFPLPPVQAQMRLPQSPPPSTINDLKVAIGRENQTALAAERIVAGTSLPLIRGRIVRRDAAGILLWGRAYGDPRLSSRVAPEMNNNSNILVVQPDPQGFPDGQNYRGNHAYVGQRTGRNALGSLVPVYVYGNPPRSYFEAKKRMEGSQAHLTALRQTLVARFLTLSKQQVGDKLTDRQRAVQEAKASLELQRFLAGRGLQGPELEARTIELQTRVAISDARAGQLSKAMEMLDALMQYKAARAGGASPTPTNAFTIADIAETGYHAANSSPTFPAPPQTYFAMHPTLYSALLGAWGAALPAYLNTATPTLKVQMLQWSRTLVDNAGVIPRTTIPVEAAPIESALARVRREELEQNGQLGAAFNWEFVKVSDSAPDGKAAPAGVAGIWVTYAEGGNNGFGDPDGEDYVSASGEREYRGLHLHRGDRMISFNGQPITSVAELNEQLRLVQALQWVIVGVYRHDHPVLLRVQLL